MAASDPTPVEPTQLPPTDGPEAHEHETSPKATGRFVIRYCDPGMFRGLDGQDHPIGWVYAVDLLDYFGVIYDDRHPGWSNTQVAEVATLYRNRAEAEEVIERMADRWPAATIVDIDTARVVDVDIALSLPDAEQATIVVVEPGTRFIQPSPTGRAPHPDVERPALPSPGMGDNDTAVGEAVLAAVDRMAEAAGPDRWPNVRADKYRQPAAALDDAQRALEKVNDVLDRAGQPGLGVDVAGAPPLEPAPDTGPDIGL